MRIAILGNSGSGKSTLARQLGASVLDLDTVAWVPDQIAVARADADAIKDVQTFCAAPDWIIEGCYAHLVKAALPFKPELIFLNPGAEACKEHCRQRPWEPHKYASREDQDAKLQFLLQWVDDYYVRDGSMSLKGHRALFDAYDGPKREVT